MNYYERYCGDYARDTAHLSLAEHGAYSLMLDTQYATECGLAADYVSLYRLCRAMTKAEQAAVRVIADRFFPVADDGLRHNPRADRDIAIAIPRIEAARINGKHGGRPRKTQEKPSGFPAETQRAAQEKPGANPQETHSGEASPCPIPQTKTKPRADAFAPPDWVPAKEWADFDEMRRAKSGKAWTWRARELAVMELEKLRDAGEDIAAVLRQSVMGGWAGLFAMKPGAAKTGPRRVAL